MSLIAGENPPPTPVPGVKEREKTPPYPIGRGKEREKPPPYPWLIGPAMLDL